jgi:ribonuclease HII
LLLLGIDEAGYGPLLGPLVISSVAMTMPDELAGIPLWQLLAGGLTDKARGANGKLIIADSKKVYKSSTKNLRELERSCLGGLALTGLDIPPDLDALLKNISLETDPHRCHPWYCHTTLPLPTTIEPAALNLSIRMLAREMKNANAKLVAVKSVPLVESRYNHLVGQIKNKSEIVFSQSMRLIMETLKNSPEKNVLACVDKQGGKDHYVRNLLRAFPGVQLSILTEGPDESAYTLTFPNRTIKIHFCQKGESKHLLIAWASIVSKYLREIFMHQFNAYWTRLDPTLQPTAGYWEDGQRFLKDIEPLLQQHNIPAEALIRQL